MAAAARYKTTDAVDFVIVGSGAAGGVLAKELSSNGFRVVVLEQGPRLEPGDFEHDEYSVYNLNALTNNWREQPNTFRKSENENAQTKPTVWYGRLVGGGSVHFTSNYWRFHEIDFLERSRKGSVPGAGLEDWPITYADLEPYYTKAEWELGVSGLAEASPFDPPRSKPYPLPPLPIKSSGVLMERGAKKLGWHAFPAPMAILSQNYRGRHACMHCGFCEAFGCEWGAKSSTLATMIPIAEQSGRCEVRANSYVSQIETNAVGRATGVVYFDKQKRERRQEAKVVVLCANGAETPRLLLMSRSKQFPNGLANSSGLVGKYLMFDWAAAMSAGVFEHPLNDFKSVHVSRVIHDFYEIDPKHGLFGGGGLDGRFDLYPVGFALSGFAPAMPQWGREFKKNLRDFPRMMYVLSHNAALAVETNTITLDPEVKDAWGLPAIRVTYRDHPETTKTVQFMQDREMELLDAAGALKTWRLPFDNRDTSVHLMGTCRMGKDPKKSVINTDHRSHDVPNLFICDGSSFVTSGRNQPTATIQALAFRAADRITTLAKKNEI
jgi:choline dehydrogenase-like flavoprotein